MLKRKDLAKEFSLIVQQEIKNHNDKLLATNVAINKLNVDLEEFSRTIFHELNTIKSCVLLATTDHIDAYNVTDKKICRVRDDIQSTDQIVDDFIRFISGELESLENIKLNKSEISELEEDIDSLRKGIHKRFCEIQEQIAGDNKRFEKKLVDLEEKMRAEFTERPAHIKKMEEHLLQKIEEHKINNSSLIVEVVECKKAAFVAEKKYEYLQTRYERLKKKIEQETGEES